MEHKLSVPVRTTAAGTLALRTGRLSSGERTGLAFTSQDALVRALGPSQQWTDLSWEALLDMLAPLGIEHIRVDPEPDRRPRTGHSPQPPRPLPGQPQAPATARSTEPSASAAARSGLVSLAPGT
ncbi:MAG TPA: SAV_915 family protein [Streptosporangiaceae bacterium]|jgi:hypothetical protein|nr:SAV_915 family protein [Streptosporangiaceae bacterium]